MTDAATSAQDIPLASLTLEDDLQPRCEIDLDLIEHYAALLMEGVALPPVVVFQEGEWLLLADGFHRLHAHQVLERTAISCLVHSGTRLDAVRYSLSANATHGKPRNRDDMVRAYRTAKRLGLIEPGDAAALRDLLHCSFSWAYNLTEVDRSMTRAARNRAIQEKHAQGFGQREIARQLEVDHRTVGNVLARMGRNSAMEKFPTSSSPVQCTEMSDTGDGGAPDHPAMASGAAAAPRDDWFRVIKALRAFGELQPVPHLFQHPCPEVFYAVEEALPTAHQWLQRFEEEFHHVQCLSRTA